MPTDFNNLKFCLVKTKSHFQSNDPYSFRWFFFLLNRLGQQVYTFTLSFFQSHIGFASSTTASVRIDGGWTTWSSFSACSATCGGGSMYRYRTCTNPAPSGGGMVCLGHDRESYGCFIQKCPTTPGK